LRMASCRKPRSWPQLRESTSILNRLNPKRERRMLFSEWNETICAFLVELLLLLLLLCKLRFADSTFITYRPYGPCVHSDYVNINSIPCCLITVAFHCFFQFCQCNEFNTA
jgi:hypothetical protein